MAASYISWTRADDTYNSKIESSWGVTYSTTTNNRPGKKSITKVLSGKSKIAQIEWDHEGAPGRIEVHKQWSTIMDFMRLEGPELSGLRIMVSCTPWGEHLKWVVDPRTLSISIISKIGHIYGQVNVMGGNCRLDFYGRGYDLPRDQKEWILVAHVLYRCLYQTV